MPFFLRMSFHSVSSFGFCMARAGSKRVNSGYLKYRGVKVELFWSLELTSGLISSHASTTLTKNYQIHTHYILLLQQTNTKHWADTVMLKFALPFNGYKRMYFASCVCSTTPVMLKINFKKHAKCFFGVLWLKFSFRVRRQNFADLQIPRQFCANGE